MMRLFLDCDGVLADFDRHFETCFGSPPRDYQDKSGASIFWRDIKSEQPTFYRDLPLMPDARELFDAVSHMRPIILTGCPRGGWAEPQKLAWANEHFPGVPMVVCMSGDKRKYCQPGDTLIDDRPQHRSKWEGAGGVWITHTSAESSIAQLVEHLRSVAA
ncbi:hypothetical protein RA27_02430 [Ruegeria sp. ANG-R]|nr:hypothetical protein RA27_02430 [Ruegeria sp. ANG-R]